MEIENDIHDLTFDILHFSFFYFFPLCISSNSVYIPVSEFEEFNFKIKCLGEFLASRCNND